MLEEPMNLEDFVENTYSLFETFSKPELATDVDHCEECRDHNDEVSGVDRRDLSAWQVGTVSWGISSFLTPEAMGYYIPRLIEMAVKGENDKQDDPYMCLFINQVGLNADADQFALFSNEQRAAVCDALKLLKDNYMHVLVEECWDDEIDNAINQWSF